MAASPTRVQLPWQGTTNPGGYQEGDSGVPGDGRGQVPGQRPGAIQHVQDMRSKICPFEKDILSLCK